MNLTLEGEVRSQGIEPKPFVEARIAFDGGMSLRRVGRRFHMTDGELRDMAPEEFPVDEPHPEGNGGY